MKEFKEVIDILMAEKIMGEDVLIALDEYAIGKENRKLLSNLFTYLLNLDVPESFAGELWLKISQHIRNLSRQLGKYPGILFGILDYLYMKENLLRNPVVVEVHKLIRMLSYYILDRLTEVYNKTYFRELLKAEINRAQRHNHRFCVLLLDIDDFKVINEVYGELGGDKVLKEVAKIIKVTKRAEDIVARFDDDEFTVLLPNTNKKGAINFAKRLMANISSMLIHYMNKIIKISVSIGIVEFPSDGKTESELIEKLSKQLYKAKMKGKNTIVYE